MRVATKGKWFVIGTNQRTGKMVIPFNMTFDTKKEAQELCEKLERVTVNYTYEVVRR